jgi:hypothetical protein
MRLLNRERKRHRGEKRVLPAVKTREAASVA